MIEEGIEEAEKNKAVLALLEAADEEQEVSDEEVVIKAHAVSCKTPRAAANFLRGVFRITKNEPSPKGATIATPLGLVRIWREMGKNGENGILATWNLLAPHTKNGHIPVQGQRLTILLHAAETLALCFSDTCAQMEEEEQHQLESMEADLAPCVQTEEQLEEVEV